MSEHTPGPWKSDGRNVRASGRCGMEFHDNCLVASVTPDIHPGLQRNADARLIAAAPDLLAAVERLYAALNSDPPDGGPQKDIMGDGVIYRLDGQAMYHAINTARDALAKARGTNAPASAEPPHREAAP